jgi:predicted amidophosphoribosyltransferase
MPLTVDEASETYASAMRNVLPAGDGVCERCKTFVAEPYRLCKACGFALNSLDEVLPITYSENLGQMHLALRMYKDNDPRSNYAALRIAAILWRFLREHERCLAGRVGVHRFGLVATVPSSTAERDETNRLRKIVRTMGPTADRFTRVLTPAKGAPDNRDFDPLRYTVDEAAVSGQDVLLIDDTWAKGGHAQSAGFALNAAGARTVALVVIGRHLTPDWRAGERSCHEIFRSLPKAFDWSTCAIHAD